MTQANVCDTESVPYFTPEEVMRAGEVALLLIGQSVAVGHRSPNGVVEYADRPADEIGAAVWDAFAATRLEAWSKESTARLAEFVDRRGLLDLIAEAVSR